MKSDDRVQSIRATGPSNRDFATYGLPRGHAASLWAAPNRAGKTSYLWLELDLQVTEVSFRVFSTRARLKPADWAPMKCDGPSEVSPLELPGMMFKATQKLPKGRYVFQAKFQVGKKTIELPGVTFRVE